jgi:hypothetical protein
MVQSRDGPRRLLSTFAGALTYRAILFSVRVRSSGAVGAVSLASPGWTTSWPHRTFKPLAFTRACSH